MSEIARLSGRRALITGEDLDLAERLGVLFASCGATVELEPTDGISDGTSIARAAARRLGGLDVLVNTGMSTAPETDPGARSRAARREVESVLERSMSLLVTTTEAALPAMGSGASIINTAAFSASEPVLTPGQEALATAVVETTQGWAVTLGPRRIRVNAVVGGPRWHPELESRLDHGHTPGQPADEEELDAFVYLASGESRHVSGSVLAVARVLTVEELRIPTEF